MRGRSNRSLLLRFHDRSVQEWHAAFQALDVLRGDPGNLGERVVGQESLVRGDQDVWEREQSGQFVIQTGR
jgi:hypothetical protein